MAKTLTSIRILIASPSDLNEERKIIIEMIKELNLTFPQQMEVFLEPITWETHAFPNAGEDPQEVINKQIAIDYDILIIMFWTKVGTPTNRSDSGTLEEFENAYKRWENDNNSVKLMVYFKIAPISPENIDPIQLEKVQKFKESLSEKGILYYKFTNIEELSQFIRVHLSRQVQEIKENTNSKKSDKEKQYIKQTNALPTIDDEDEGFLDLIEKTVDSSLRASEVLEKITSSLKQLNDDTQENTKNLESIGHDEINNLNAYKRASNRQADNMSDFVIRVQSEIPILDDALSSLLDSTGRTMMLFKDFGENENTLKQMKDALITIIE